MSASRPQGAERALWAALRARPLLALALLVLPLYVPWIAAIPVDGTLEGNRLEAAREMLRSGDWLVPHLGGEVYLSKPPLHPWTIALCSLAFGNVHVWGARALSAVAALGACALVLVWGRRELGTRAGFFAAIAAASSVLLAEKAMRAELETELTFFTTLALVTLWRAGWAEGARTRPWSLAAGLALGAAVLVKGPPPLFVFLCAVAAAGVAPARRRCFLASGAIAVVLGLLMALAWVLPVIARLGFASAWSSFHAQFLERLVKAGGTNVEPFWFYVPALLAGLLPATLYLPCVALVWPGRVQTSERARVRAAFLWGWALGPLVLFSLSSGKETRYLLPTVPAWALLIAWGWVRARVTLRMVAWRRFLARALGVVTWIAPPAWLVVGWLAYPEARAVVALTAALALVVRAGFVWSARARRPAFVLALLALAVTTAKIAWAGTALAKQRRERPVEEVAGALAARLAPEEAWVLLGGYRSWWHFAVDRPCRAADDWAGFVRLRAGSQGLRLVLAPEELVPAEVAVERAGRWVVDGDPFVVVEVR